MVEGHKTRSLVLGGLLAAHRATLGETLLLGSSLLLVVSGNLVEVSLGSGLGLLVAVTLLGTLSTLALDTLGSDETLNRRSNGALLALRSLLGTDDELADIIGLLEVEELADLGSTLGSKRTRADGVGKSGNLTLSLLHNDKVEDGDIGSDNASTDRLSLALSLSADSVARVSVSEEKTNTVVHENTLLHGETLLVVSSRDTENVSLELVSENISVNLVGDTLVVESAELDLIIDLDELLESRSRV